MDAATITALAALISAIAAMIAALSNRKDIRQVHAEVVTGNANTIGGLAEIAEGRRVRADVHVDDQTGSERHAVHSLEKSEAAGIVEVENDHRP